MKTIKLLSLFLFTALAASCSSVRVSSDYDDTASFGSYKTYAYFKEGIDKVEISDLDKKRIMRAIDAEMQQKGFTKSDKPDLLINIFTKSQERVNVNTWGYGGFGWGYGWGWGPGFYGSYPMVSSYPEGTLYIDLIDAGKKELVWQGIGNGVLTRDRDEKQDRINEFVQKILAQFPPETKK